MAKENTKEIAKKAIEKIRTEAEINEAYFVGLLWSNPFDNYGEYGDLLTYNEFIHDVWGFYFELGKNMYKKGIKTFDVVTVNQFVAELNVEVDFERYGGFNTIDDVVNIVKHNIENIGYYYETIKKNYIIRELVELFGEKVLVNTDKYKWEKMTKEQLITYWHDKMNKISLNTVNHYETENLYIDPDEFIERLIKDSAEMLPFYDSRLMNSITQGVPRGHVTMIGGFGGTGKALALDTPIPTPNGWTMMGDLKVGDTVFGADGKPTKVIYKSPVFKNHDVYEITFDDGEKILADAEHQWIVMTDYSKKLARNNITKMKDKHIDDNGCFTITTEEMKNDFVRIREKGWKDYKYKVPMNKPVEYSEKDLLIKPYTLGLWLGDGTSSKGVITVGEQDLDEIKRNIEDDGYTVTISETKKGIYSLLLNNPYKEMYCEYDHPKNKFWRYDIKKCRECDRIRHNAKHKHNLRKNPKYYKSIMQQLRELNVLNNKHIPVEYLQSSIEQRYELLKGLMDSDGYVDENGYCVFSQNNKIMIDNFSELLSSLGIKHSIKEKITKLNGKEFKSYYVSFYTDKQNSCFKLKRKHNRLKDHLPSDRNHKSIINIQKVDTVPVQCIMVDNNDHLYLAGKRMTVTHNTSIVAEKFVMSCVKNGEKTLVILNEEDAQSFRQKIVLSILFHEFHTGIDRKKFVKGDIGEKERELIHKAFQRMYELINGEEALIKLVFMERYVMKDLEKIVKYWANRGYVNLLIDTHKVSESSEYEKRWETFVEDMKTIYRLTRKNAGGLNLRTVVTFQLADKAINKRFLDYEAIGEGKAAKNEASIVFMFRPIWDDEYKDGKHELECWRLRKIGENEYDKEYFKLERGKTYYLWFTPKNRFGSSTETGQPVLILEPIFNANSFKEVGWTYVPKDRG